VVRLDRTNRIDQLDSISLESIIDLVKVGIDLVYKNQFDFIGSVYLTNRTDR